MMVEVGYERFPDEFVCVDTRDYGSCRDEERVISLLEKITRSPEVTFLYQYITRHDEDVLTKDSETKGLLANEVVPTYGSYDAGAEETRISDVTNALNENKSEDVGECNVKERLKFRDVGIIASLCLSIFFSWASVSVLAPFYPTLAASKGASPTTIGFVVGVFYLVIFATAPLVGSMIARVGVRPLMIGGTLCHGIFTIVFGLMVLVPDGWPFVTVCFAVRILQAVGSSVTLTTLFAFIAANYKKRTVFLFGLLETFSGVGLMLGPVIGGLLYEAGGFGTSFYTLGGLQIISGIVVVLILPDISDTHPSSGISKLTFLARPGTIVVLATVLVGSFYISFIEPILAPHLDTFDLQPSVIGAIFFTWPAVYAITAPICGHIVEKYNHTMAPMMVGVVVNIQSLLLLGPAPFFNVEPALWMPIVSMVEMGIAVGGLYIAPFAALNSLASEFAFPDNIETYGMVVGTFNAIYSLGGFLGSSVAGILADQIGFDWACVGAASIFFVNGLCLAAYGIFRKRSRDRVFLRLN